MPAAPRAHNASSLPLADLSLHPPRSYLPPVQGCTSASIQDVLNKVAGQYGVSADALAATCEYNYQKPTNPATAATATTGRRHMLQATTGSSVCRPRVTLSISMPLQTAVTGNYSDALRAANAASDAIYAAVGDQACYVPTGDEAVIGTTVTFETGNERATCEYILQVGGKEGRGMMMAWPWEAACRCLGARPCCKQASVPSVNVPSANRIRCPPGSLSLQAFASSNNLTADLVRTFRCDQWSPSKPRWSAGMIALFVISGILGVVLIGVVAFLLLAWRRRHAANMQWVSQDGTVSGSVTAPNGHPKVVPADAVGFDPHAGKGAGAVAMAVAEGVDRPSSVSRQLRTSAPDSPNRRYSAFGAPDSPPRRTSSSAVPPVAGNRVVPV